jgi:hypothetical protein
MSLYQPGTNLDDTQQKFYKLAFSTLGEENKDLALVLASVVDSDNSLVLCTKISDLAREVAQFKPLKVNAEQFIGKYFPLEYKIILILRKINNGEELSYDENVFFGNLANTDDNWDSNPKEFLEKAIEVMDIPEDNFQYYYVNAQEIATALRKSQNSVGTLEYMDNTLMSPEN